MPKKELSEQEICNKFITPALEQVGWEFMQQLVALFSQRIAGQIMGMYKPNLTLINKIVSLVAIVSTTIGKMSAETGTQMTGRELAEKLKLNQSAIAKNLSQLQKAGILSREGSTKVEQWDVLAEEFQN